ncbi:MAG: SGNH/GDSL hydrolase family protein [Phycisphaerae bacterium]|nr:SGNH/GDSL hydrolase family protein [Phycisphaerae bacterium]
MIIRKNQLVVFQGDSITDCGREPNDWHMGVGYATMTAGLFGLRQPQLNTRFLNRGVGGDTIPNLQRRWQADCIDLKPDWVSLLIGINDSTCWARGDEGYGVDAYEAGYRDILTQSRDCGAGIIICEPFLLDTPHEYDFIPATLEIRKHIDPIIAVARKLADEFADVYIPLDEMFDEASRRAEPAVWAADAIHPTLAGHALIADAWVKAVEA